MVPIDEASPNGTVLNACDSGDEAAEYSLLDGGSRPLRVARKSLAQRLCRRCPSCCLRRWRAVTCGFLVAALALALWMVWWRRYDTACLRCPSLYYAATACVLGGQKLRHRGWSGLHALLLPGSHVRAELEALLSSSAFRDAAACPRWATGQRGGPCVPSQEPAEGGCPTSIGTFVEGGNCTPNLYEQPAEISWSDLADSPVEALLTQPHSKLLHVYAGLCEPDNKLQLGWAFQPLQGACEECGQVVSPTNLCMTVNPNVSFFVHLEECAPSDLQLWRYHEGQIQHSSGLCIRSDSWGGARVELWKCSQNPASSWALTDHFQFSFDQLVDGKERCLMGLPADHVRDIGHNGCDCTCPDGRVYTVNDMGTTCRAVACWGGTPSACKRNWIKESRYLGAQVQCQPDFAAAAGGLADAAPSEDESCWAGSWPAFVWPGFVHGCDGFEPTFTWLPVMNFGKMEFTAKPTNLRPAHQRLGDFGLFYSSFYSTAAGEICREHFGERRPGGPALRLADEQEGPPVLSHSVASVYFEERPLLNGARPWLDSDDWIKELPNEMQGATLYMGLGQPLPAWHRTKKTPLGMLTFNASSMARGVGGTAYLWCVTPPKDGSPLSGATWMHGDGGISELGWDNAGSLTIETGPGPYKAIVFRRRVAAHGTVTARISSYWVGGAAFQPDDI